MIYYTIYGEPSSMKEEYFKQVSSLHERREYVSSLIPRCDAFNHHSKDAFIFFVELSEKRIAFDAVCKKVLDQSDVDCFLKEMEFSLNNVQSEEILFEQIADDLKSSSRNSFISDRDEILERLELDDLTGGYAVGMRYGENLADKKSRKELIGESRNLLTGQSFVPEIENICRGKRVESVEGHPVHYMIFSCEQEARKNMTRLLLSALYSNGRVKSRRYSFVDICDMRFSPWGYDRLCQSMAGGTIVVRFDNGDDEFDGDRASNLVDVIDSVCKMTRKYRNTVQTIICLPRGAERLRSIVYNLLGNVAIVELKEDLTSAADAIRYLRKKAKLNAVTPDKELSGKIETDGKYLPYELDNIFSTWFDCKLRTEVFPQYADAKTGSAETQKEKPRGSAYEELMSMIGLEEAKSIIKKVLDFHKFNKLYGNQFEDHERPSMHTVFSGSPGTAKTTVARLLARILKDNGVLSAGTMIECGRSDLVGKYVGWTANIVKEKFKKATGGVLFIDEAYSLVDDRSGSYGDEAINTIVQEMENHREDVMVIFAGYADKMEGFLNKNPGLRSRISWHVPFPDYSAEELTQIADLIAKNKGLTITPEARKKIFSLSEKMRFTRDFGNGRYVRNLMERAKMNQTSRVLRYDPDKVTRALLTTITAEDIEIPVAASAALPARRIGFGA